MGASGEQAGTQAGTQADATGDVSEAPLAITPAALDQLWRKLWSHCQYLEEDIRYAYNDDDRYRCKIAAGAAGFGLTLIHEVISPGRGACTPDCDHVKPGLSPEQVVALLAQIDHHLARTAAKAKDSWVGEDGATEHAALQSLLKAVLASATPDPE